MAAIVVVWTHAWEFSRGYTSGTYNQRLTDGGIYAIFLFFVMSGFLLFWPFAQAAWGDRSPVSVRNYALNRAWRVMPAYYVCLAVVLVVQYHGGSIRDWVAFSTFTENFSSKTFGQIDTPMWSIATEMQFYVALPLIAWGLARVSRGSLRTGAIVLAALAVASFIARQLIRYGLPYSNSLHYLDYTVLEFFCYFALGMGLAMWRLSIRQRRPKWLDGRLGHSTTWIVGGVLLWMFACYHYSWELPGALASVLIVGAVVLPLRHGRAIAPFRWRPLALLGVISYSIYLWHWPILIGISNRSLTSPQLVVGRGMTQLFVLGLPLSAAVAALSYWQIERRGLAHRRPWSANTVSSAPEPAISAADAPPAAPSLRPV